MGTLVAGFGSGALVLVPGFNWLVGKFTTLPTFLGSIDVVETTTRDGVLYARQMGKCSELIRSPVACCHPQPIGLCFL